MPEIWDTSGQFGGIDSRCFAVFDTPFIGFRGQLYGCCNTGPNLLPNENDSIFHMDLKEALNSPKYVYMKKMITGQEPAKDNIVCTRCNGYKRMKKNNKWIEI